MKKHNLFLDFFLLFSQEAFQIQQFGLKETIMSFDYVGQVAGHKEFETARLLVSDNRSGIFSKVLPLYEADNPRCISIVMPGHFSNRIICGMQTSAGDDDGLRPLNPNEIFAGPPSLTRDEPSMIRGSKFVSSVYSSLLEPKGYYKCAATDIPPLLIAISDDSGLTWTHKFIANRGRIDSSFAKVL